MTDNCPKLFSIEVKAFPSNDVLKINSKTLFSFGFGFTGSTLVGINVKEMLSTFVSSLSEVPYHDQPDYNYEDRFPTLDEIAILVKKIAEKYISHLGVCYPNQAGCEFVIFGYCVKNKEYKAIKLFNTSSDPINIQIETKDVSNGKYLILGDKKVEVEKTIKDTKNKFTEHTLNWWRAPFIALSIVIKENNTGTIGGYLQFCISNNLCTRLFYLVTPSDEKIMANLVGFDIFKEIGMLGGFLVSTHAGMSMPSEDGW